MKRQVKRNEKDVVNVWHHETLPCDIWAEIVKCLSSTRVVTDKLYQLLIKMSWLNKRFLHIVEKLVMPQVTLLCEIAVKHNHSIVKKFPSLESLFYPCNNTLKGEDVEDLALVRRFCPSESLGDSSLKTFGSLLTTLNLCFNTSITNNALRSLTSLTKLVLNDDCILEDETLLHLSSLTTLKFATGPGLITNKGLENVASHLLNLSLSFNRKITNEGIQSLTNLRKLFLYDDGNITGDGLKSLPSLKKLILPSNHTVRGEEIMHNLPSLEYLNLGAGEYLIQDDVLLSFPKLHTLVHNGRLSHIISEILKKRGVCVY